MEIKYHESTSSIEINDVLKKQHFFMRASAIFNIANTILFSLFILDKQQLKWFGFIWIGIGLFSLGLLFYYFLKKTTQSRIEIADILSLQQKSLLGRKRFSLKLKNGKQRDLPELRDQAQVQELTKFLRETSGYEKNTNPPQRI